MEVLETPEIKYQSDFTCPECGHTTTETLNADRCQYFYECDHCHQVIKPRAGDCCVYCSYGSVPCPHVQEQINANSKKYNTEKLLKWAFTLSLVTIIYNLLEGVIATSFGAGDETLALFGFGVDSFVEVLSGLGIAHMIWRMRRNTVAERDVFEITALRVTGTAFYLLTGGLVTGALLAFYYQSEPQTTLVGVIVSSISIATMYILYSAKNKVGRQLESQPIISDANCTKSCFYLSFILLTSSLLYELFQIPYVDAAGSLGIAWYAFKEGKEAFENARTKRLACGDGCC